MKNKENLQKEIEQKEENHENEKKERKKERKNFFLRIQATCVGAASGQVRLKNWVVGNSTGKNLKILSK